MLLLGVTGGIGMGKSTAQSLLQNRQVPVIDTDQIARDVVEPGQPALDEIRSKFGSDYIDEAGVLRRSELAALIFLDPQARRRLEAILHPRIQAQWQATVEEWRSTGIGHGAVVIPLLFETETAELFDHVICVACSAKTQLERLHSRQWTDQQIQQRVSAQWPIERKMARSDFVVWTEGELGVHEEQWTRILAMILGGQKTGGHC